MNFFMMAFDAVLREKSMVFSCNLSNYEIACQSYLDEIAARPFEDEDLYVELLMVIRRHQTHDLSAIHPHLCRWANEKVEDYLERCFVAWQ